MQVYNINTSQDLPKFIEQVLEQIDTASVETYINNQMSDIRFDLGDDSYSYSVKIDTGWRYFEYRRVAGIPYCFEIMFPTFYGHNDQSYIYAIHHEDWSVRILDRGMFGNNFVITVSSNSEEKITLDRIESDMMILLLMPEYL